MTPFMAPTAAGLLLAAMPFRSLRMFGAAVLGLSIAADSNVQRSPTVPGASDNATGVAAVIALAGAFAAEPLTHVDVALVFPGCEESGMGGMAAWLRRHGGALDPPARWSLGWTRWARASRCSPAPRGRSASTATATPTWRWRMPARRSRASRRPPAGGSRLGTDPVLARFAGLPAISMLSLGPLGMYTDYHRMTDTPDRVDWTSAERCTAIAAGIARAFATAHAP